KPHPPFTEVTASHYPVLQRGGLSCSARASRDPLWRVVGASGDASRRGAISSTALPRSPGNCRAHHPRSPATRLHNVAHAVCRRPRPVLGALATLLLRPARRSMDNSGLHLFCLTQVTIFL